MTSFQLAWTPTREDGEEAIRAKQESSRILWFYRVMGAVFILVGIDALVKSDLVGIVFVLLGALVVDEGYGQLTRRVQWRRHPARPVSVEVDDLGVTTDGTLRAWSTWQAQLVLPDAVVLLDKTVGWSPIALLPKRGLSDPAQWDDLTALVTSRVRRHRRPRRSFRRG